MKQQTEVTQLILLWFEPKRMSFSWVGETKSVSSLNQLLLVNVSVIKQLSNPWSIWLCKRMLNIYISNKSCKGNHDFIFPLHAHRRIYPELLTSSKLTSAQEKTKLLAFYFLLQTRTYVSGLHCNHLGLISAPQITPLRLS